MRFDLNSPAVAQYHWGTLFCQFSPAAPVQRHTFVKVLASLAAGRAPWQSDEDFRACVALLHELVHLGQDLTTGLGHTDFLTNWTTTPQLLNYASIVVHMDGACARPPFRQPGALPWGDEKDAFVADAENSLRYYPASLTPPERLQRIRGLLQEAVKKPVDDESLRDFSAQTLLETDAALGTIRSIKSLAMSPDQQTAVLQNKAVFELDALGPEYSRAVDHLAAVLKRHTGLNDDELEPAIGAVYGVFVDIALAFPPLSWIDANGRYPDDFDPGVKYFRLLVAVQQLHRDAMELFWNAFNDKRYLDVESLLRATMSYPYPSSEEVYAAWRDALTDEASSNEIARLRLDACLYRLRNGVLRSQRGIGLLFDMEAPIVYFHKDHGFVKHDWGNRILDARASTLFTQELLDNFMVVELANFLFRTGEFRCPHAQADVCLAVEEGCGSGFVHHEQLPDSTACRARRVLTSCNVYRPT